MSRSGRGIPGVVNTVRAMLDDFETWQVATKTPNAEGVSLPYTEHYIYIGPDGRPVRITRDDITQEAGPDEKGLPPGRYEIRVIGMDGNECVEPFVGEHIAYDELSALRRSPSDVASSAFSAVTSELETALRNTGARLRDAERREEKYRRDCNTYIDQNANLLREKGMLMLRTEQAEGYAKAAKEEVELLRNELAALREETAMFKPHAQLLVQEGVQYLARAFGIPMPAALPSANDIGAPQVGDPMPQNIGAEDPLGRFNDFFAATIANPYFCAWAIEQGTKMNPPITWPLVRALFWAHTKCDLGAVPDWERMFAEYDAERAPVAAE